MPLDMAEVKKRAIGLRPARELVYKILEANPDTDVSQLDAQLGQAGYHVSRSTIHSWRSKSRMARRPLTSAERIKRTAELKPARTYAHGVWEQAPDTSRLQMSNVLKKAGYVVNPTTVNSWLVTWRKKRQASVIVEQVPALAKQIRVQVPIQIPTQLTWEQVIKAFPDRATLADYLLDGVLAAVNERNELQGEIDRLTTDNKELSETVKLVTEDRAKVMQQLNHYMLKEKGVTFRINEAKRILVPKPKGGE